MQIAIVLSAYDKMSTVVKTAADRAKTQLKSIEKVGKSLDKFGNNALIAGGIGTAFFASTVVAAEESTVASNRLRQVFKSMGQEYEKSTAASEAYASQLQLQIGVEDEAIMAVQAKLATFERAANAAAMSNGIYNRATAAAFDMQAAGFGEASQNIVKLGKALQDPITGINALRRSGITFTDAEKKKIKALVESKKIYQAQNMIMKALERQVGGVAGSTVTGTQKMRIAMGEVSESIGKMLLPAFNQATAFITSKVIPAVQTFTEQHPGLVKGLAIVAVSLLAVGTAAKIMSFMMLTNPVVLIIAAIAAAAMLIMMNWGKVKAFFQKLWDKIGFIFKAAFNVIKFIFFNFNPIGILIRHWGKIRAFFTRIWAGIKQVFSTVWKWVKIWFFNFSPVGLVFKHWNKIRTFFTNIWAGVKNIFNGVINWFASIGSRFFQAGKNMIMAIWRGIKAVAMAPVKAVEGVVKKIRDLWPFSPAKAGPLRDIHRIKLMETIAATINPRPIMTAMNSVVKGVAGVGQNNPSPVLAPIGGGGVSINFAPTLNGTGDRGAIMNDLRTFGDDLLKQVEEAQRKKDRAKF